jgi:aspartate/methionine/tyrosine aminotransferase
MSSAPYMEWAKLHVRQRVNLSASNLLHCELADLPGAREALELHGDNDSGYRPLVDAIGSTYGVTPEMVAVAQGTSGANFLVFAALVKAGDEVLVERPGYDPLMGPPALLGANVTRFDRRFEDGYRLDPDAVRAALTPRTRLIVVTNAHNPSGVVAADADLDEIGRMAERHGARVLVDEVYLDTAAFTPARPAAARSPVFISTSSLTKSYGLAGLRCGWAIAAPKVAEAVRRARDIVDGSGAFPTERLSVLAFSMLDRLAARAQRILTANGHAVREFLASRSDLDVVLPQAGTVVFPRIRGVQDAGPFVERLARDFETDVVPGRFFQAPAHFRVAFGGRAQVLAEGLAQLRKALDTLSPEPCPPSPCGLRRVRHSPRSSVRGRRRKR